jgi:hypothetical protein
LWALRLSWQPILLLAALSPFVVFAVIRRSAAVRLTRLSSLRRHRR